MPEKGKVLVVDDSMTNVFLLQTLLEEKNYEVMFCYDGKEAIEHVDNEEFDLILLDLMMPNLDGFDVLRHLNNKEDPSQTKVIIITAREDTESQRKALELGATEYLTKPVDIDELMTRVSNHLN